jgi:DNA-directed RNA polymerase subunit RPC12/RpoP
MTDDAAYGPTDARPGQPTCLHSGCRQFNKLELESRCPGCGHRTMLRPRPDLFRTLGYQPQNAPAPPMPSGAPSVPPMPLAPPPASLRTVPSAPPGAVAPLTTPIRPPTPRLSGRETASRAVFGGFWCLVAIAGVVAMVSQLADGNFGGFLLSALVATASGFYARYIFRGGRFRILFF